MELFFRKILGAVIGFAIIFSMVPLINAEESYYEEFTLEEITVTAQKRSEDEQKVPIPMEVISNKDFAAEGATNVDDILSTLSSVFINTSSDGMRVSIRGLTDIDPVYDGRKSSSPTVAVNIDGAYNGMSNAGQNLFDIERMEVLMGPQSTMYASNSPGGIVNVITASPKTDKYSASASAEFGSYNRRNFQTALNAPLINDKLAMRLAASSTREDSYVYKDAAATKNDSFRLKTLWNASDSLSITLTGNWSKSGNAGMMGGVVPFVDQDETDTDPWTISDSTSPEALGDKADQITKGGNAIISWSTSLGDLTITPNYSKSSSDGHETNNQMGPSGTTEIGSYKSNTTTQKGVEARMVSPEEFTLFTWIFGLNYYKNDFTMTQDYDDPDYEDAWSVDGQKQKAIYGNITYPLLFDDKFSLIAGYRRSWDKSAQDNGGYGQDGVSRDMDYSKPDYKFGFQYDMADNIMLYANYASSYRTDSKAMTNPRKGIRPPEELKAYTMGAKTRMFDNTVQVNGSTYYYDYRNKYANDGMKGGQYTAEEIGAEHMSSSYVTATSDVNDNGEALYQVQENGSNSWGDCRTIGADISASWLVSPKDVLNFSVSYLNMVWKKLRFEYEFTTIWPDTNYDDTKAPNSPTWSMTASYEHNFELGSYGFLTPHIDVQHKTSFDLTFDNKSSSPYYGHQEPYYLWNASMAFDHSSGKWSVNAIVKNITNYAVKKSYSAQDSELWIGDPRTYSATLSVKF